MKWGFASIALRSLRPQHVGDMFGWNDSARTVSGDFHLLHGSAERRAESDPTSQLGTTRLDSELRDFLVRDDEEVLGIVDEVRADGTILVACGWFGRRHVLLSLEDIKETHFATREVVLHSDLPRVEEVRAGASAFGRLMASLVGRSAGRDRSTRRSR